MNISTRTRLLGDSMVPRDLTAGWLDYIPTHIYRQVCLKFRLRTPLFFPLFNFTYPNLNLQYHLTIASFWGRGNSIQITFKDLEFLCSFPLSEYKTSEREHTHTHTRACIQKECLKIQIIICYTIRLGLFPTAAFRVFSFICYIILAPYFRHFYSEGGLKQ